MRLSRSALVAACVAGAAEACVSEHRRTFHPHKALSKRQDTPFPPELTADESVIVNSFDNRTIDEWSYYYTHGLHLAGTNRSQAQWTADRFSDNGFTSFLVDYYTYLNYPVEQSLSLSSADGTVQDINLQEDVLAEDETTSYPNRVPTFHGYSWTGCVEEEYIYVGRGQQVDFEELVSLGVELKGKIALARYGGPFRGLKVKNAQNYGMIGVVIFTDTADDGNITEANGYAAYPNGFARNPSTVQRGSVQFLSQFPGDPTTPDYPSKFDSPRQSTEQSTPRIPSLPVSYVQGQKLLQALDGFGIPGADVNRTNWVGALNATYSTGPAPGVKLNLNNVMQDNTTYIWDAIGVINGTSQDEVIVLGNHRDAWIIGGAADPNSGTAILVELSKAFGALLKTGWRPKRTIVLASWDAEEYGLLGSTEFVEEYIPWINKAAVTYLNVDVGTSGPDPILSATPDIHKVALDTMKKIVYPYRGYDNLTLYDVFYGLSEGEIDVLGSGSDFTAFLHNGVTSLDVGTDPGPTDAVYHYHSDYDSYHWMTTFGDPGFGTHKVIGQYLSLLAYNLASHHVVPLDAANYGAEMQSYLADLEETIAASPYTDLDVTPISDAIATFNESAAALAAQIGSSPDGPAIDTINGKLRDFSRGFASQGGLPNRPFFKHAIFAPGLDTGYAPTTFPGVTEAIEIYDDRAMAESEIPRAARAIEAAAAILSA